MAKFCKNCGTYLHENDKYCEDCGKPTTDYCLKCGESLLPGQKFCPECGAKTTRMSKPLAVIIAVIGIVIVVGLVAFFTIDFTEMQEVQVDTFSFEIPDTFTQDTSKTVNENDDGIKTKSKMWVDDEDFIEIEVTSSKSSKFNPNKINDEIGGQKENRFGYDGYFNDFPDAYTFSFVKDGKLCTIYTSYPDLLDHMDVL